MYGSTPACSICINYFRSDTEACLHPVKHSSGYVLLSMIVSFG